MKIEHPLSDFSSRPVTDVKDTSIENGRVAPGASPAPEADEVRLSGSLRLLHDATKAVTSSGEVRPDAVRRGREALAAGLDSDLDRLADGLIDAMIQPHDPEHS